MATRAARNNNPGNLWTGGRNIFPGQIGTDSGGFAIFSNWDAGVAAADSNLQSYANKGWTTPSEIATHWSTTDQIAYTNNLASALGVTPNTPINLSDAQVRNAALGAIFHQEDSNYQASQNPFSSMWDGIKSAADTGNPLTFPWGVAGIAAQTLHGVLADAGNAITAPGTPVGNVLHFDLGNWLNEQATGAAKQYILPLAVGIGAVLLMMISAWGLVKDTGAGQAIKSTAKVARVAAVL